MGTKQIIKNSEQKQFSCWKKSTRKWKRAGLIKKKCLGGYFDLSSKTYWEFFFKKKKFQKNTSVNFVGPDPRLMELGAKWRTYWEFKLKIKKNQRVWEGWLKRPSLLPCTHMPENLTHGYKKDHQNSKNCFLVGKIQLGSGKERALSIKSVLEDVLIYHLRLIENFFFWKKSFKKLQVLTL